MRNVTFILYFSLVVLMGCSTSSVTKTYNNPIIRNYMNTSMVYDNGKFYYLFNDYGIFKLACSDDATNIMDGTIHPVFNMNDLGLTDLWHPQIIKIDDQWYIYTTADDGETDNHRIHVLRNKSSNPLEGHFEYAGRIVTDKNDNWAIHAHVFQYKNKLYMLWSGWESQRVFAETQHIYIAEMANPIELSSKRVKISSPEYEWELQWIQNDGSSYTRYPVFVNESPFFFCNNETDKAYVYYSASANWTSYICFGELSANKDSDFLDANSWKKNPIPVFSQNPDAGIYGPSWPYIISSNNGNYYFLFCCMDSNDNRYKNNIHMQKLKFDNGHPIFGEPMPITEPIMKP